MESEKEILLRFENDSKTPLSTSDFTRNRLLIHSFSGKTVILFVVARLQYSAVQSCWDQFVRGGIELVKLKITQIERKFESQKSNGYN